MNNNKKKINRKVEDNEIDNVAGGADSIDLTNIKKHQPFLDELGKFQTELEQAAQVDTIKDCRVVIAATNDNIGAANNAASIATLQKRTKNNK